MGQKPLSLQSTLDRSCRRPHDVTQVKTPRPVAPASAIREMTQAYQKAMAFEIRAKYISAARAALAALPQPISVATACSGCDIAVKCLELLLDHLVGSVGSPTMMRHVFACEFDPNKRTFLEAEMDAEHIFGDVADLSNLMALDFEFHPPQRRPVPHCCVFMAGFSYRSRTALSSRRNANKDCLQRQKRGTTHSGCSSTPWPGSSKLKMESGRNPVISHHEQSARNDMIGHVTCSY